MLRSLAISLQLFRVHQPHRAGHFLTNPGKGGGVQPTLLLPYRGGRFPKEPVSPFFWTVGHFRPPGPTDPPSGGTGSVRPKKSAIHIQKSKRFGHFGQKMTETFSGSFGAGWATFSDRGGKTSQAL